MKNQTFRMTMLLDFYGDVLTERQKEFFDLYYNEDLSLSEIAENYGISRQGVRDVIVRAEAVMTELEDKTGLMKRFMQIREKANAITAAAEQIKTVPQMPWGYSFNDAAHPRVRRVIKGVTPWHLRD